MAEIKCLCQLSVGERGIYHGLIFEMVEREVKSIPAKYVDMARNKLTGELAKPERYVHVRCVGDLNGVYVPSGDERDDLWLGRGTPVCVIGGEDE